MPKKYKQKSYKSCFIKYCYFLGLSLFTINALAKQPIVQDTKLTDVTVYLHGAELSSSDTIDLVKGEQKVIFTNLANNISAPSLAINVDNNVVVKSFSLQSNYLSEQDITPSAQAITKELKIKQNAKDKLLIEETAINAQLKALEGNYSVVDNNAGIDLNKLVELLDLIQDKTKAMLLTKLELQAQISELDIQITKLQKQLDLEQGHNVTKNNVEVVFYAPEATKAKVKLSYLVNDASWQPIYDIKTKQINQPLTISYKANIYQRSGLNWNQVNLTLSTGNPKDNIQVPLLKPWKIYLYSGLSKSKSSMQYSDAEEISLRSDLAVSKEKSVGYVAINNEGIHTNFAIATPYDIAANGQEHIVFIQDQQIDNVKYRYISMPKRMAKVFVQAKLPNWQNLNLMNAPTNIFVADQFIGQGFIDTKNIIDNELYISMGVDNKIQVQRVENKDRTSKETLFGNSISKEFAYTTTLQNTNNYPVEILITEQIPISQNEKLEVLDLNYGKAKYDPKTGYLEWQLKLDANQTRKLEHGYKLKYPKDRQVVN